MSEPSDERHEVAGNGRAGTARRAAGHALKIVRVVRGAVMNVLAGEVVGVFAHVERAHEDGARVFQPLDQRGVARGRRPVAVDLRAGECPQAGDVEQIFDREGNAGERAERLARGARLIERLGARKSALFGDLGEGIEQRIVLADAGDGRFDDADGARTAVRNGGSDVGRGIPHELRRRRLKHGTPAPARHRRAGEIRRPALRCAGSVAD